MACIGVKRFECIPDQECVKRYSCKEYITDTTPPSEWHAVPRSFNGVDCDDFKGKGEIK